MAAFSFSFPRPDCVEDFCSQETLLNLFEKSTYSRLFLAPWYRWDSVQYLEIAEYGYQIGQTENSVWPPLYPFLIRNLSRLMPPIQAALLISTLSLFLAFYFLHQNVSQTWDKNLADRTLLVISIFPSSLYLMAAYTESLFFCLALVCILAARLRKWGWAGVCGILAAITRQLGLFLILPVFWEIYESYFKEKTISWKEILKPGIFAALIPLGTGINFGYVHFILEMPWPWETISNTWSHHLAFPWAGIINNTYYLFTLKSPLHKISLTFDLFFSILFIILLLVKIPKMPVSYRIFGACCLLPTLVYLRDHEILTSISRYVLPIFPAFITLAYFLKNKNLKLAWLTFSLIGFFLLLLCFYKWIWVA